MGQSFSWRCSRCATLVPNGQPYCPQCGQPLGESTHLAQRAAFSQQIPPGAPIPLASLPLQDMRTGRRSFKRVGCLVGMGALILVLVLGSAGYLLARMAGARLANAGGSIPDATPTQSPIKTTLLGETITYSSVIITLVSAQQASRFADDNSTSSVGALRLNIHESQSAPLDTGGSRTDPYYGYDKPFHLLLPGGKLISSEGAKNASGPTGKATQDNWIDFSVPTTLPVNQLSLRIGDTNEAQMDVPLRANADLSAYQPQVVHPATRVAYGGMFWTLTTASKQWSDGGKQAGKGQRFLVVAVSVDNPSSSDVNGYPPDYLRLRVNGTLIAEANDNLPLGFAAGTSGSKGLVAFLVPEQSTSFVLVLLGNSSTQQATIPFTLP